MSDLADAVALARVLWPHEHTSVVVRLDPDPAAAASADGAFVASVRGNKRRCYARGATATEALAALTTTLRGLARVAADALLCAAGDTRAPEMERDLMDTARRFDVARSILDALASGRPVDYGAAENVGLDAYALAAIERRFQPQPAQREASGGAGVDWRELYERLCERLDRDAEDSDACAESDAYATGTASETLHDCANSTRGIVADARFLAREAQRRAEGDVPPPKRFE